MPIILRDMSNKDIILNYNKGSKFLTPKPVNINYDRAVIPFFLNVKVCGEVDFKKFVS